MPVPPSTAPPTARPQRVSRTDQQQAVEEMEAAAKGLESVLADTEDMGKERQLYRFESGIRELNQLNALKRAEAIQEQHQEVERRGSWNAALGGQVVQKEAIQEDCADESKNDTLGYHGGALVTRTGGWFTGRKSLITDGEKGESNEEETTGSGSFQGRTSIRASMRIVGTLTPALLRARRRSSVSTNGSGRPLTASADAVTSLPPVPSRRSSMTRQGSMDIGSVEERQCIPNTERIERNSFAADTGGDESKFLLEERRPNTARVSARRRSSTQQDSSSTRVTGKIDYAALLNEQEQDMQARRVSTDQYKNMLDQVEVYQQKMLQHLDSQLVFMGITEKDIEATAQQLSEGKQAL